jgi:hypothetical protein
MVPLETVLDVLPVLSLVVVLGYYSLQVRNQNRDREVQIILQINNNFNLFSKQWSKFMYSWNWTDFNDFWEKYGPETNLDEWSDMMQYWTFIENLGVLVRRKSLSIELIDDVFAGIILDHWEKAEPIAVGLRELWDMPDVMIWTEQLSDELIKIRTKRWT